LPPLRSNSQEKPDGNLQFAIHGSLLYGFKTPLNTAGPNGDLLLL